MYLLAIATSAASTPSTRYKIQFQTNPSQTIENKNIKKKFNIKTTKRILLAFILILINSNV